MNKRQRKKQFYKRLEKYESNLLPINSMIMPKLGFAFLKLEAIYDEI